jgi:hypothetical protein
MINFGFKMHEIFFETLKIFNNFYKIIGKIVGAGA